jgi:hypothetical protein
MRGKRPVEKLGRSPLELVGCDEHVDRYHNPVRRRPKLLESSYILGKIGERFSILQPSPAPQTTLRRRKTVELIELPPRVLGSLPEKFTVIILNFLPTCIQVI